MQSAQLTATELGLPLRPIGGIDDGAVHRFLASARLGGRAPGADGRQLMSAGAAAARWLDGRRRRRRDRHRRPGARGGGRGRRRPRRRCASWRAMAMASRPTPSPTARRLIELLAELDALATGPAPVPPGCALAEAIAAMRRDRPPAGVIWTAEEALVLPPEPVGLAAHRARCGRLSAAWRPTPGSTAYAALAQGRGSVVGDVPDPALLDQRLRRQPTRSRASTAQIVALELHGGRPQSGARHRPSCDRIGAREDRIASARSSARVRPSRSSPSCPTCCCAWARSPSPTSLLQPRAPIGRCRAWATPHRRS